MAMVEVEIGKIYITEALKEKVEEHRKMMIEANPDKKDLFEKASFGMLFSDYLMKYVG